MVLYSADDFLKLPNYELLKNNINITASEAFNHEIIRDTVGSVINEKGYIGYLIKDNKVVACGFANNDTTNSKTMYIHTFAVHKDYRGRGLCQMMVSEFIKRFGKKYILYLTVRTETGNENTGAIRCYEKQGFIMLPEVYRDHYDGKNTAMIRIPKFIKKSKKKTKKNKRKKII